MIDRILNVLLGVAAILGMCLVILLLGTLLWGITRYFLYPWVLS
jgi:hypothetical protein